MILSEKLMVGCDRAESALMPIVRAMSDLVVGCEALNDECQEDA